MARASRATATMKADSASETTSNALAEPFAAFDKKASHVHESSPWSGMR